MHYYLLGFGPEWRWWMWTMNAYREIHSGSRLVWCDDRRSSGAQSGAFITWTGWTLAMALVMITAP